MTHMHRFCPKINRKKDRESNCITSKVANKINWLKCVVDFSIFSLFVFNMTINIWHLCVQYLRCLTYSFVWVLIPRIVKRLPFIMILWFYVVGVDCCFILFVVSIRDIQCIAIVANKCLFHSIYYVLSMPSPFFFCLEQYVFYQLFSLFMLRSVWWRNAVPAHKMTFQHTI